MEIAAPFLEKVGNCILEDQGLQSSECRAATYLLTLKLSLHKNHEGFGQLGFLLDRIAVGGWKVKLRVKVSDPGVQNLLDKKKTSPFMALQFPLIVSKQDPKKIIAIDSPNML